MTKIALFGTLLLALTTAACVQDDMEPLPPDEDDTEVVVDDDTDDEVVDDDQQVDEMPIADFDNDSVQNPAVTQFLTPTGDGVLYYTNDISFPAGDSEDFVEFTIPNNSNPISRVWMTLDCAIDGPEDTIVEARIWEDGVQSATERVTCNEGEQPITINNTKVQTVRIYFLVATDATYVDYTLTVKSSPFL